MDDSIIAVIAAIAIGMIQLVASINKKKKGQQEQRERVHPRPSLLTTLFDMEAPEGGMLYEEATGEDATIEQDPVAPCFTERPKEEGGPAAQPFTAFTEEEGAEDEESLLHDFTPRNAILFSEVMNPRWNA